MRHSLRAVIAMLFLLVLAAGLLPAGAAPARQKRDPLSKIDPSVLAATADGGATSFIIVMAEQADTSGAAAFDGKEAKGRYVYERLVARFADPPCTKDRVVQRWERTYGRWPPRFQAQLEAILPLMAIPLAIDRVRGQRSYGLVVGLAMLIAYHQLLQLGEALADNDRVPTWAGLWLPYFAFVAVSLARMPV